MKPLLISTGEPAGVGPELVLQLALEASDYSFVAIADLKLLQDRAAHLNLPIQFKSYFPGDVSETKHTPGVLPVWDKPLPSHSEPGILNAAHAPWVVEMLTMATQACLQKQFSALVTAPVHKGIINDAGIAFRGHTELLAEVCGVKTVVMMLAGGTLRVALVTTHLPLSAVSAAITPDLLTRTLDVVHHSLKELLQASPRILVCGLNPHAGEGGHLGREEIEVIEPVLQACREKGYDVTGPLPADTAFTPHHLAQADVILTMYHDQGLPVLKSHYFHDAVNVTLGLPMVRTSVDHGTALDLAGTGRANPASLRAALEYAGKSVKLSLSV